MFSSLNLAAALAIAIAPLIASPLARAADPIAEPVPIPPTLTPDWRPITFEQRQDLIERILRSPMGVGAYNQLAIEGFISYDCSQTFYQDQRTGFRFLLRVKCPTQRGVSPFVGYDEIHVVFDAFEGSINGFELNRYGEEIPAPYLPSVLPRFPLGPLPSRSEPSSPPRLELPPNRPWEEIPPSRSFELTFATLPPPPDREPGEPLPPIQRRPLP
ncbi:MAG: hypothetical protein Fur0042_06210 [Cyanophyceae cyanobacterium]